MENSDSSSEMNNEIDSDSSVEMKSDDMDSEFSDDISSGDDLSSYDDSSLESADLPSMDSNDNTDLPLVDRSDSLDSSPASDIPSHDTENTDTDDKEYSLDTDPLSADSRDSSEDTDPEDTESEDTDPKDTEPEDTEPEDADVSLDSDPASNDIFPDAEDTLQENEDTPNEFEEKEELFGIGEENKQNDTDDENDVSENIPVKDLIGPEEYNAYKDIYDNLDKMNIPQDYKKVLVDRFVKMDDELKSQYNKYSSKLNCLDTKYTGGAYFSDSEGGFKLDHNEDVKNPLGAGNTYFHESGHMIDYLKGIENNSNNASVESLMPEKISQDFQNAIDQIAIENSCDKDQAMEILSNTLKENPYASNVVSDVFGGVSNNKVVGYYGHDKDYWSARGSDVLGKEAYAGITADRACNNIDSIHFAEKYLPNTLLAYKAALKK